MKQSNEGLKRHKHYTTWRLIKAYWQSSQRLAASLFAITIIAMTVTLVAIDVMFNYWYNHFYDALQAYNRHATVRLLVLFFILAAFYIVVAVYRYYISQLFGLRWRKWLTEKFIDRWLSHRGYYYLENFDKKTDNPDQRIQEDIASLTSVSIELSTGLITAVTTFFAFIYVLWHLSGTMVVPLGSFGTLYVPGYLVWVSLIYSIIGTLITFKVGKPLIFLNFEQQKREATFRYAATDLRRHAENVALYRGEDHQKNILERLLIRALDNWYLLITRQKLLLWFTSGYNQTSVVLPLVVALPNYFDKVFLLGGLIQSIQAFTRVQEALSFIVNAYPQIANWRAVNQRLTTFINHLEIIEDQAEASNQLNRHEQESNSITMKHLDISTPQQALLLKNVNQVLMSGESYLIKGESGIGKSTLIRTIAGIWPYAAGELILPKNKKMMFLPQKPYMPIGTLAEAILFPDKKHPELEKQLEPILKACNLEQFQSRLNETAAWSEQLSPGEQQRIAFARVLLHQPDWVFLDESTSMLDKKNEELLYKLIKTHLPHCSVVSVGHGASLDKYHTQIINTEDYRFSIL